MRQSPIQQRALAYDVFCPDREKRQVEHVLAVGGSTVHRGSEPGAVETQVTPLAALSVCGKVIKSNVVTRYVAKRIALHV